MAALLRVSPVAVSLLLAFPSLAQQTVTLQSGISDARITCCDTANTNEGSAGSFALISDSSAQEMPRSSKISTAAGRFPLSIEALLERKMLGR